MTGSFALLAGLLLAGAAPPALGPPPPHWLHAEAIAGDVAILKGAGVSTTDADLVTYIRKRTLTTETRALAKKLIEKLGDDEFDVREQASADLAKLGPVVVPLLRPVLISGDLEQKKRVKRLLSQLEPKFDAGHVPAAARLLAARKVARGTAALLDYLPAAANENESEQIREALVVLSCPHGKPDRDIVAALADADPIRRAAAAYAVGQSGNQAHAATVLKLLTDKDEGVRMRAALGLALAQEKKAVPVLIELMGELPSGKRTAVESMLIQLAENPPVAPGDDTPESGKKRKEVWAAWWEKNRTTIDLGRLRSDTLLGYTLCVIFESGVRVAEFGRDNKVIWEIKNLSNAVDAHIVPGNRVLITEYGAGRVIERTFAGKQVWEYKCSSPILAQRLANGNTFITTMSSGVLEVDRTGKTVSSRTDLGSLRAGWKYPDGKIAIVTSNNQYRRFTASGKEEKTYAVPLQISNSIGGIDFLPDGGLLAVTSTGVVQYDSDGKKVWEAKGLKSPYCPTRLRNGNTLVACTGTRQFIEFDRSGNVVRKIPVDPATPWLGRRR